MRVVAAMVVAGMMVGGAVRVWGQTVSAQQAMGSVATQDALVTGGLEVQGERVRLMSNVSVTAHDHAAAITLERGGEVLVCATSEFHLLHSGTGNALLFGLDRGAVELRGASEAQDVILTPDIRFSVEAKGTYDLRVRVAREGDTCVENAGEGSPVLILSEAFSPASYRVMPGQHVLFEHGSLREVVDNERSACGCPSAEVPVVVTASASPAEKAKAEHPFPAAASEGLAVTTAGAKPVGDEPSTVTLSASPGGETSVTAEVAPIVAPAVVASAPPQTPPGAHSIAHSIGRFFHRLFHPGGSS
jgi:hypothetical protein